MAQETSTVLTVPDAAADKNLDALLAGLLNSEPRMVLLQLTSRSPKTSERLSSEFLEVTQRVWTPLAFHSSVQNWLHTLQAVGKFVRQMEDNGLYVRTLLGDDIGRSMAHYGLVLSAIHGISTYGLFGGTSSNGNQSRGPRNRLRVLELLGTISGDASAAELAAAAHISGSKTTRHLHALRDAGMAAYKTLSPRQNGMSTYSWVDGKTPEDVSSAAPLRQMVADALYDLRDADRWRILHRLERSLPAERLPAVNDISYALITLRDSGFATSDFTASTHSVARITPQGRQFLAEHVPVIYAAAAGDAAPAQRAIARMDLHLEALAASGMRRYVEASPWIKQGK